MSNSSATAGQLAEMFKALGNPHRLELFRRLSSCCTPGTVCDATMAARQSVGELGEQLTIAPSTLSHHLKELNRAGLIHMQRDGKSVKCWVEPATLKSLTAFFGEP
jgi:ArsR family transcriptional regulator